MVSRELEPNRNLFCDLFLPFILHGGLVHTHNCIMFVHQPRRRTQVQARSMKTQKCHKGAKEQIMFQSSHQLQEAYQRRKGKGNLKTRSA